MWKVRIGNNPWFYVRSLNEVGNLARRYKGVYFVTNTSKVMKLS